MRPKELHWFYQDGASRIYPDHWEKFLAPIPDNERTDLLHAYHRRLMGNDRQQQLEAARAWSLWEGVTSNMVMSDAGVERFREDKFALALARIETHYFVNHGFMDGPGQVLRNLDRIRTVPAVIVQGRYDLVCPMTTAWELHRAWPEAEFRIVADAGHSAFELGTVHELVSATDRFAE
jgi:proline iminopeptidase